MDKCNNSYIKSIIFLNPKDIKVIDEKGIVMKRKYGKFNRKAFKFDNNKQ